MTQRKQVDVAIAGATGAVGEAMLEILEARKFPVRNLYLLASERSEGKRLQFRGKSVTVQRLDSFDFSQAQIGLFSAGGKLSAEFAPKAASAGCVVVDNTSHFRYDQDIPLIVPEVNAHRLADHSARNIIANPNCSTIQMIVALAPIHQKVGIKRIVVSTYQAVSGTGKKAIDELENQIKAIVNNEAPQNTVYPYRIAFNCLPHIDVFLDNGYTKEEMKMVHETRKILEDDSIGVTATTVRVPVYFGHSESVNMETREPISPEAVKALLKDAPGVLVVDDPSQNRYPMAIEAEGKDDTLVGRIRADESIANGINMWIVADNIRKGAATNAVQIAEILAKEYLAK